MTDLALLSNGRLRTWLTDRGDGLSQWQGVALTRWREDAALAPGGIRLFLRDAVGGVVWSAVADAAGGAEPGVEVDFDAAMPAFSRRRDGIDTHLSIALGDDGSDVELRRLRVVNRSDRRRELSVTSFAELVLAPPATDAAHPAFAKLFVETEIDAGRGAIVATRRPSTPKDARVWLFHAALADGAGTAGRASFETDRMRFVGRGRDASAAAALSNGGDLSGSAGPVLDACAAIRIAVVLEPGASTTLDFLFGVAADRDACLVLHDRTATAAACAAVVDAAAAGRAARLAAIGGEVAETRSHERLAAALLVADPRRRGDPAAIATNRRGQAGLWPFGISGDVPIVVLDLRGDGGLGLVAELARAHAWWRQGGIACEALVVAASPALAEVARRALGEGPARERIDQRDGIVVRDAGALDADARTLFEASARIVFDSDRGATLAEASGHGSGTAPASGRGSDVDRGRRSDDRPRPLSDTRAEDAPTPASPAAAPAAEIAAALAGLADANGHGGFAPDRRSYVVAVAGQAMTPAPWCNVLANAQGFGSVVSESGSAFTWSENAHEFRLTPWCNDPVGDAGGEAIYLRDDATGRCWSPTLLPTRCAGVYVARHGFGHSRFEHAEDGIESTLTVFVAAAAPVKLSHLTLRNASPEPRRLSVTGVVEWVLGDERAKTLLHVVTELDAASGAIHARNGYNTDFAGRVAFFDVDVDVPTGPAGRSASGDRVAFYGRGGSRAAPQAMRSADLDGRFGAGLDPCAAHRLAVALEPGAEVEIVFRLGAAADAGEARSLCERFRGAAAAKAALAEVEAYWQGVLGRIEVETPDPHVDALANGWLLYQLLASRLFGRTGYYQSSGAYGFRDQLQDSMALVHAAPELVRAHLLRAAARQFGDGDVQHWWHPPTGKGVRTRCSDDFLWLPFVAARYVEATGDAAVLDEACPFLEADALKDGEASSYSIPRLSAETASLYEHAVRAIRHGRRYGAHGLPLMGGGDWNDGMDLVGAGGKGESVWLGFFLVAVLKRFAPLAEARGDDAFAAECRDEAEALAARIDAAAWDGEWYLRAWFDDGTPLGSRQNRECRIDSIAQSWAVISAAAPRERAVQAMDSLHRHLVKADLGVVQLLDPPFDTQRPSPGYIAGYVPGIRENGGQYTHGAMWSAIAFAELGDADRAWELFRHLDPLRHGESADAIATYRVEPYVLAGDVYAFAPHAGRGGWTWYTGSAGWMHQLVVESLLGFRRRGDTLRLEPLLPAGWPGFSIRYRHGEHTRYSIECRRADGGEPARTTVDGTPVDGGAIALADDGVDHAVVVTVAA